MQLKVRVILFSAGWKGVLLHVVLQRTDVLVDVQKKKEEGKEAAAAGRPRLSAGELRMQKGPFHLSSWPP